LYLDQLDANQLALDPDTGERMVRQLRARTMPPVGAERPDTATYDATIAVLTSVLDEVEKVDKAAPPVGSPSDSVLAARLAKLLWNSEPDQPLRAAAAKGSLHDA